MFWQLTSRRNIICLECRQRPGLSHVVVVLEITGDGGESCLVIPPWGGMDPGTGMKWDLSTASSSSGRGRPWECAGRYSGPPTWSLHLVVQWLLSRRFVATEIASSPKSNIHPSSVPLRPLSIPFVQSLSLSLLHGVWSFLSPDYVSWTKQSFYIYIYIYIYLFIFIFIFVCVGSLFLCKGFL